MIYAYIASVIASDIDLDVKNNIQKSNLKPMYSNKNAFSVPRPDTGFAWVRFISNIVLQSEAFLTDMD